MVTPTRQQFAEWHQQYDMLYAVTVDEVTVYLHAPERAQLIQASVEHQDDPIGLMVYLLHRCWLGGDPILKVEADDQESELFMLVVEAMAAHYSDWVEILL